jgi:hypothetical protein
LRSLYQEPPRSDTFCHITSTIEPVSNPARQLPPTRTRRRHARLTGDAETRPDQTGLGISPPSPRCLTSYRVSPACLVSRIGPELPLYLGSAQSCRTLFARVTPAVRANVQHIPPRLDPTPNAHLSVCAGPWPETRHDRPYAAHLTIQFSKTSTHSSCDYRSAFRGCPRAAR